MVKRPLPHTAEMSKIYRIDIFRISLRISLKRSLRGLHDSLSSVTYCFKATLSSDRWKLQTNQHFFLPNCQKSFDNLVFHLIISCSDKNQRIFISELSHSEADHFISKQYLSISHWFVIKVEHTKYSRIFLYMYIKSRNLNIVCAGSNVAYQTNCFSKVTFSLLQNGWLEN